MSYSFLKDAFTSSIEIATICALATFIFNALNAKTMFFLGLLSKIFMLLAFIALIAFVFHGWQLINFDASGQAVINSLSGDGPTKDNLWNLVRIDYGAGIIGWCIGAYFYSKMSD